MTKTARLLPLLACFFCCTVLAQPAPELPIKKLDGKLVDEKGRGLYTYDGDNATPGRSMCDSQCRLLWPPLYAADGAQPKGPFTLAIRSDGSKQWALRGKPLYRWTSDKKWGDAGGDGIGDKWRLVKFAKPAAPASATTAPSDTPAPGAKPADTAKPSTPAAGTPA